MIGKKQRNQTAAGRKVYQKPYLKRLGSLRQLTLKIGSNTDGMNGHFE